MGAFLSSVANIITSVIDFLVNGIKYLVLLFKYLGQILSSASQFVVHLPLELRVVAIAALMFSVIFVVVGR